MCNNVYYIHHLLYNIFHKLNDKVYRYQYHCQYSNYLVFHYLKYKLLVFHKLNDNLEHILNNCVNFHFLDLYIFRIYYNIFYNNHLLHHNNNLLVYFYQVHKVLDNQIFYDILVYIDYKQYY